MRLKMGMVSAAVYAVGLALAWGGGPALASDWEMLLRPVMNQAERNAFRKLQSEEEREGFRSAFWAGKRMTEQEYLARFAQADQLYGSGKAGSGANTDQGRLFLANGAPNRVHRLPSSRIFVACEVWQYDSLPGTGYRAQLQFLFFRKAAAGDYRLYWPGLHSIRDLLLPQPGTRGMFPVNDVVTANDIRGRLKYSPGEEEVVEAATGVARGITGMGNSEILARATSPAVMVRYSKEEGPRGVAVSRVAYGEAEGSQTERPQVRVLQFRAGEVPVVDVQVRTQAAERIALQVELRGRRVEQSAVSLTSSTASSLAGEKAGRQAVLYSQRFFLPAENYTLTVEVDGQTVTVPLRVTVPFGAGGERAEPGLQGEGFAEMEGERRISILPDPRTADAAESAKRVAAMIH